MQRIVEMMSFIPENKKDSPGKRLLLGTAVVLGASLLKIGLDSAYEQVTGGKAPKSPRTAGVGWGRALLWSAAAGAVIGAAKVVLRSTAEHQLQRRSDD